MLAQQLLEIAKALVSLVLIWGEKKAALLGKPGCTMQYDKIKEKPPIIYVPNNATII